MGGAAAAHLVHFYAGAERLAESLSSIFTEPLGRGEAVVVVASPEHRDALDVALADDGVNLAAAYRSGRYLPMDVGDAVAAVMTTWGPDPQRFRTAVVETLEQARRRTGTVHVYGEMAGVVAAQGDLASAMAVESLCHGMLAAHPFRLICGYPREIVRDQVGAFDTICGTHDAVVASRETTEPVLAATVDLPLGPASAATARRASRDVLSAWSGVAHDTITDAGAVVTEFVAAAARNGSARVTLGLALEAGLVVVSMTDPDRRWPPRLADLDVAATGRSFALLGSLTQAWGVESATGGVRIWARLRTARP